MRSEAELNSRRQWKGIDFRYFPDESINYLQSPDNVLQVHCGNPAVTHISNGTIPPGRDFKGKRRRGAYDEHDQFVSTSVPFRRGEPASLLEVDSNTLQSASHDPRAAYFLGWVGSHYGHFLLESLSRAWAWREFGGGRVAVVQGALSNFARSYYGYVDGLLDRIEEVQTATRFSDVLVPSPAFVRHQGVYTGFRALCEQIIDRALPFREATTGQPLYLSRAGLGDDARRACLGEDRLEQLLQSEGFKIVRPETLPIAEQIALFNRHRWIVAPIGSACHTKLFCREPVNLVILAAGKVNPNFLLCDLITPGNTCYANVLRLPKLDLPRLPKMPRPRMLADNLILETLKDFGLVRPGAAFPGPAPALELYKQTWLALARKRLSQKNCKGRKQLQDTVAMLTGSPNG